MMLMLTSPNPSRTLTAIKNPLPIRAATGLRIVNKAVKKIPQPNTRFPPICSAKRPPGTWVRT